MPTDEQVGGSHYDHPVNHWDWAQYLPYLEGCATKYFGRHRDKHGLADIKKGLSYVAKICKSYYGVTLTWTLEENSDYNPNQDREN